MTIKRKVVIRWDYDLIFLLVAMQGFEPRTLRI